MQISYHLIRRVAQYLETNTQDSTGQALLEQLRFVLKVQDALTPIKGGKYLVDRDRASRPKVQNQSTVKLRDFVRHKTILSWFGQVRRIEAGETTVTLEEDGLVVSAPLDDWEVTIARG